MGRMSGFPPFSAACLKGKGGHGMTEEGETEDVDSVSSSASASDSMEEFTSSASSSPPPLDQPAPPATSLHDMSSLSQHLPFKRGLSKFYQGKSQSFTSLSDARCLEDLAKPEIPYNKKLKSSRRCGGGLSGEVKGIHKSSSPPKPRHPRHHMAKKVSSRGCHSEMNLNGKSAGAGLLLPNRPPIPPHTPSSSAHRISNQAPLFA